jgi:hypothetical protein
VCYLLAEAPVALFPPERPRFLLLGFDEQRASFPELDSIRATELYVACRQSLDSDFDGSALPPFLLLYAHVLSDCGHHAQVRSDRLPRRASVPSRPPLAHLLFSASTLSLHPHRISSNTRTECCPSPAPKATAPAAQGCCAWCTEHTLFEATSSAARVDVAHTPSCRPVLANNTPSSCIRAGCPLPAGARPHARLLARQFFRPLRRAPR